MECLWPRGWRRQFGRPPALGRREAGRSVGERLVNFIITSWLFARRGAGESMAPLAGPSKPIGGAARARRWQAKLIHFSAALPPPPPPPLLSSGLTFLAPGKPPAAKPRTKGSVRGAPFCSRQRAAPMILTMATKSRPATPAYSSLGCPPASALSRHLPGRPSTWRRPRRRRCVAIVCER